MDRSGIPHTHARTADGRFFTDELRWVGWKRGKKKVEKVAIEHGGCVCGRASQCYHSHSDLWKLLYLLTKDRMSIEADDQEVSAP